MQQTLINSERHPQRRKARPGVLRLPQDARALLTQLGMTMLLVFSIFFSQNIFAARILGTTSGKVAKADQEEPSIAPAEDEQESRQQRRRSRGESSPAQSSGYGVGLSVGLGFNAFSGRLTLINYFSRFMSLELSGYYNYLADDDKKNTYYGPELDFVFRLPNPTVMTPYVGAGPGYEKWQRVEKGNSFDTSASVTLNYFAGVSIRFTKYLSLGVGNRWTQFLNDPPRKFGDHEKREERTRSELSIGFAATL